MTTVNILERKETAMGTRVGLLFGSAEAWRERRCTLGSGNKSLWKALKSLRMGGIYDREECSSTQISEI